MPYQIEALSVQEMLKLTFTGPVTIDDRAAALREFVTWLGDTGFRKVLVDFRHGWTLPADLEASKRHAANLAREYASLKGARIAYVSGPEPRSPSPVEMLAAAHGYFYERFTDIEAAMKWLA